MSLAVRILRGAQGDLLELAAYLRREAPSSAARMIELLLQRIERLGELPEKGPVPRDARLRRLGFRYLACGRHIVFYKVTRSQVRIYRVVHQRRAYEGLL